MHLASWRIVYMAQGYGNSVYHNGTVYSGLSWSVYVSLAACATDDFENVFVQWMGRMLFMLNVCSYSLFQEMSLLFWITAYHIDDEKLIRICEPLLKQFHAIINSEICDTITMAQYHDVIWSCVNVEISKTTFMKKGVWWHLVIVIWYLRGKINPIRTKVCMYHEKW